MTDKLTKWLELAKSTPLPVLSHTIKELRTLCRKEDIPLKEITHLVERDPGLIIQILHSSNNRTKSKLSTDITHIHQAFRLMGTDQLTRLPENQPLIEDTLTDPAKTRLLEAYNRAYHAARFATDWAALRRDMTPDEVFAATQLHFLGEMQLAIHAPDLLAKVAEVRVENHMSSEEAQFLVFGFTLNDFTLHLANDWQFPPLVKEALHQENAKFPRAYGIMLGVQLARSICYEGWYAEKTYELQESIAEWLGMPTGKVIARIHKIAAEIAREIPQYGIEPAARLLPLIRTPALEEHQAEQSQATASASNDSTICLSPQLPVIATALKEMAAFDKNSVSKEAVINHTIDCLHDGIGLNRVVFCRVNNEKNILDAMEIKGADNDPLFSRFQVSIAKENLFSMLLKKQQAILINDSNRTKFWSLVPGEFQKLIHTNSFVAMSVFVNDKPFGLFYADRHTSMCQIDENSYNYFKKVCITAAKILSSD